ncbi:MAG: gamma-glutamyl-gamma-aminobutyrate hydrolase family protein [Planctomycetes bacterium]|nr:gamma-glutamyl-gamma-aminobutyrate hydrolase family protein [Planctomycetota bacterium]
MAKPVIGICMDFIADSAPSGRDRSYLKLYPQYPQAVARAGGIPVALPILDDVETLRPLLGMLAGVVLVGSDDYPPQWYGEEPDPTVELCTPQRYEFDRKFVAMLYATDLPVLAICGGMQMTAIHHGGALIQDIAKLGGAVKHRDPNAKQSPRHEIAIEPNSKLAEALGATACTVNSLHHQALRAPVKGWRVSARAPDGVIEAMEAQDHRFRICTQWHPERMGDDAAMQRLWKAFVAASSIAAPCSA